MKNKAIIYFLCSPSLGILDNWLPVLSCLRQEQRDIEFSFILSKPESTGFIDLDNILIQMSQSIFDSVIFPTHSGNWLRVNSFEEAIEINRPSDTEEFIFRWMKRLETKKIFSFFIFFLKYFLKLLDKRTSSSLLFQFEKIKEQNAVILYDVYEEHKAYLKEVVLFFDGVPKFSVCHGLDINQDPIFPKAFKKRLKGELTAYLFSDAEVPYYEKTFLIDKDDLKIIGIPRHNKSWIESIQEKSSLELERKEFVFLISRSLCRYFPFERKKEALKSIKKVIIDEMGLKLIIKRHPKEASDGLFEEVLGIANYNITWFLSNEHPFVLGKNSLFSLSFYSGVSLDMIFMKRAVIEYLDLKNLKGYDDKKSLRDDKNSPVLSLRYLGLVHGVSNYRELKEKTLRALENNDQLLDPLRKKYETYFRIKNDAIEIIKEDILKKLDSSG